MQTKLVAMIIVATVAHAATVAAPWSPAPPPQGCAAYSADLYLVGISRSMLAGGRLEAAKADIVSRVDTAPPCSYVAVATFGITSDIIADGYPDHDPASRARLKEVVVHLKATARNTNLDEGAKTAQSYVLQLANSPRKPHPIRIVAYTDDISSPSPGKPKFSLAEYLAARMNALHLQVADDFSAWPAPPPGARRIKVEELPRALGAGIEPKGGKGGPLGAGWAALTLGTALVAVAVFVFRRRRNRAENQTPFVPGSLVVSEFDEDDRGNLNVLSDSLGRAKRDCRVLLYDTITPIRFSANANLGAYIVEAGAGIPSNEVLFSVIPAGASELFIDGAGLSVDGEPVPADGRTVDARDGVTLKWGQRVFQLGIEPDELQTA